MYDYEDYLHHDVTLSDQKFSAWALSVGAPPLAGFDDLRSRNRRNALPDVDFSRAVPDASHGSLLGRIVEFFCGGRGDMFRASHAHCLNLPLLKDGRK
jgi:hypothetical protein